MRNLHQLDQYRDVQTATKLYGFAGDHETGIFRVPSPIDRRELAVIASSGMGWDHVSVSRSNRCPNWTEMDFIKRLFFQDDETAMQLHVPADDHVNVHGYCLHLWRPLDVPIPRPPSVMVGPK